MSVESIVLILSVIAVLFAISGFILVIYVKAKIEMLEKAPVLRQYVERFVPIDNSEEAQKILKAKMLEQERAFDESLGLAPSKPRNSYATTNILRAEELV